MERPSWRAATGRNCQRAVGAGGSEQDGPCAPDPPVSFWGMLEVYDARAMSGVGDHGMPMIFFERLFPPSKVLCGTIAALAVMGTVECSYKA